MLEAQIDAEEKIALRPLSPMTPFILAHVGAVVGPFLVGWSPQLLAAAFLSYAVRMWAITAGYHRYFSHRSFETSRFFQFVLAFLGTCASQKGVLWWAAHHRHHHRHSDEETDVHSPGIRGFVWSHLGWFLCSKHQETRYDKIQDFARYPELVWLNRYWIVPPVAVGALLWIFGGTALFVWAGLVATVVLWHSTFTINSLAHIYGKRRFATRDDSKNNWLLALLTFGEGWHNNHHYYPGAARQGFFWWEIDLSYYVLKVLERLGVVWNVRGVPEKVMVKARELS